MKTIIFFFIILTIAFGEKFDGYIKRGIRYIVKKRKGGITPPSQHQMNTD